MDTTSAVHIRQARQSDNAAILSLVAESGLPVDDLCASHALFLIAERGSEIAGCAGIELPGIHALMRSLAVKPAYRGAGIGTRLLDAIEQLSRQRGVRDAYLLTLTAEQFFTLRGYQRIERRDAPPGISSTTEFTTICPVSSALMAKRL
jgi:amino-acid N-acetyltransferase